MPLEFTSGECTAISFASDHPDGFSSADLKQLNDLLPVLARLCWSRCASAPSRSQKRACFWLCMTRGKALHSSARSPCAQAKGLTEAKVMLIMDRVYLC